MKSVLLIRHTKSDWSNILPDFDRPIREDRKDDAKLIAKEVQKRHYKADYIAASPAKRTMQTAKLICDVWELKYADIVHDPSLYESSANQILSHIRSLDKKISKAVIVCHNPSVTNFVNTYTGSRIDNVPTTGAVLIHFDCDKWNEINGEGRLEWFLKPKELRK